MNAHERECGHHRAGQVLYETFSRSAVALSTIASDALLACGQFAYLEFGMDVSARASLLEG